MYNPYGNPQQPPQYGGTGNGSSMYPQQTGYVNNWSTQQQPPQQQRQQQGPPPFYGNAGGIQTQPTGYGFGGQPPMQQQPLTNQATGWGQPQIQQQQQPLANQATGWNTQIQQSQQQPLGAQKTGFQPQTSFGMGLAAQVTGWQQQQQPQQQQPLMAQPTGFTSAFQSMQMQEQENRDIKIPNIRLSFITAKDQEKFEHLFRVNVPRGESSIDGAACKKVLMQSGLTATKLADIWALADISKSGHLLFPEFALALHLCNLAIKGEPIPFELPTKIKNEVTSFIDTINFAVADGPSSTNNAPNTPFNEEIRRQQQQTQASNMQILNGLVPQQTGYTPMQPQATGFPQMPVTGFPGLQAQATGALQPQKTGTFTPLTAQQTSGLIPLGAQRTGSLVPQQTGFQLQQQPMQQQRTGSLVPQQTGFQLQQPMQQQRTGGLVPQQTGFQLQQQPMQQQRTGSLVPQQTGLMPQATGLMPQPTGLTAMPTGRPGEWGFVSMPTGGIPGLDMMQSHFMPNASSQAHHLTSTMGGNNASNVTWAITKQEKLIYDNIFKKWDTSRKGYVEGEVAISVFGKSGLNRGDLEQIWNLADLGNRGKLNKDEFAVAMHLIYRRLNGFDLPTYLPPELIPPSSKMLQESMTSLKGQLKNDAAGLYKSTKHSVTPSSFSRDGSRFKNDDSDIGYVSNSRHRNSKGKESSESTNGFSATNSKLTIEQLKKSIHEKKILLDAIDAADEEVSSDYAKRQTSNEIEMLKTKIRAAQSNLNSTPLDSGSLLNEKHQVTSKLNKLSDSVPQIIKSIQQIDEEIMKAKIELFRLKLQKENPSGIEIRGSGPKGAITESDKRIAKQKASLQAKMAALTGKPAPSFDKFEDNEEKLNQEIQRITAETQQQQSMIKDISVSITDLVSNISTSLNSSNSLEVGYTKWELGQGVQNKEVLQLIEYLNASKPAPAPQEPLTASQPQRSEQPPSQSPAPATIAPTVSSPAPVEKPVSSPETVEAVAPANTPSDRARRIKEQAEKRMQERLAKLGLRRSNASEVPASASSTETPSPQISSPVTTPAVVEKRAPPPPTPRHSKDPLLSAPASSVETVKEADESSSDDDEDDEEMRQLIAAKKALEIKERERKLKKKSDRDARLAKLRAEMEALKKQEEAENESSDGDDTWGESKPKAVPEAVVEAPSAKKDEEIPSGSIPAPVQSSSNNPFAKMTAVAETPKEATSASIPPTSTISSRNNNPFFKSTPEQQAPKFDSNQLQAQRNAQRGMAPSDDGWSDSEKEDEDEDDMPATSKQAELASMLFGGMRTTSSTDVFDSKTATPVVEKPQPTFAAPPPIPVAEPLMVIPSSDPVPEIPSAVETPAILASAPKIPEPVEPAQQESESSEEDKEFEDAQEESSPAIPPIPTAPALATNDSLLAPLPDSAPVALTDEPTYIPPPPPPAAPPVPVGIPPIPSADVPVAPPPPPPPVNVPAPQASAPTGAPPPNALSALLGDINAGKKLRKVNENEKHIVEGGAVGKVL